MLIVTGTESRHQLYCRLVHHPAVMKFSPPGFAITIERYKVRSAGKSLQSLPRGTSEELVASQPEPQKRRQRTAQFATPATMMTAILHKAVAQTGVTTGTVPVVTPVPTKGERRFSGQPLQSQKMREIQDLPFRCSEFED